MGLLTRLSSILVVLGSLAAFAWDGHAPITETALSSLIAPHASVPFIPLEEALKKGLSTVKARTPSELIRELKLRPGWDFPLKLGEKPGQPVPLLALLAMYTDEPDWGVDRDLFDAYPELWTADTPYVAGRHGVKSQGFRHLYFPGHFEWSAPISSLQLPMHPVGRGPFQAELYLGLAHDFFNHGSPYWGYRMLAWSFHYTEDLFQPFHTRQLPTKHFLRFRWNVWHPDIDIDATGEQIGYYHFCYEWLIHCELEPKMSPLRTALMGTASVPPFTEPLADYLRNEVVPYSTHRVDRVATLVYQTFPPFHPKHGELAENVVGRPAWAAKVHQDARMDNLRVGSREIFQRMGQVVRRIYIDFLKH